MNKEQIYDEKIHPLMRQIIAICKEHGIAMISSFSLPTEADEGLCCTTCLPDETGKNGFGHKEAVHLLRDEGPSTQVRILHKDGSQTIAAHI